jgi:hypothetical protein
MQVKRAALIFANKTRRTCARCHRSVSEVILNNLIHIKDFQGPENYSPAVILLNFSGEHFGQQSKL